MSFAKKAMNISVRIKLGGHMTAFPSELHYLEARENYTLIVFKDGRKVLVATTLGKLEARLSHFGFYRNSRGFIINLDSVCGIESLGNRLQVRLRNDLLFPVSKRRCRGLLQRVNQH